MLIKQTERPTKEKAYFLPSQVDFLQKIGAWKLKSKQEQASECDSWVSLTI